MEQYIMLKDFAGYEISNTGKVRSIDRVIEHKDGTISTRSGRYLKLRTNKIEPHLFFEVSKTIDGKKIRKTFYIHKVVAEHFGPTMESRYLYVEHINGNYKDNHIDNLRWITQKQLMAVQPKRIKDPSKAWITRRLKYGKIGSNVFKK